MPQDIFYIILYISGRACTKIVIGTVFDDISRTNTPRDSILDLNESARRVYELYYICDQTRSISGRAYTKLVNFTVFDFISRTNESAWLIDVSFHICDRIWSSSGCAYAIIDIFTVLAILRPRYVKTCMLLFNSINPSNSITMSC